MAIVNDLLPQSFWHGRKVDIKHLHNKFTSGRQTESWLYDGGNYQFSVVKTRGSDEWAVIHASTLVISTGTFEEAAYVADALAIKTTFPCEETDREFYFPTAQKCAFEALELFRQCMGKKSE